jgi:hypothetical protein
MTARIGLVTAVVITICGAGVIVLAALGANGVLSKYLWPANAMIWCWLWYAEQRTSRRLRGELDAAMLMRRRASGGLS